VFNNDAASGIDMQFQVNTTTGVLFTDFIF
jgi:hypothetical protein